MTVKELIENLLDCPPDATVYTTVWADDQEGSGEMRMMAQKVTTVGWSQTQGRRTGAFLGLGEAPESWETPKAALRSMGWGD